MIYVTIAALAVTALTVLAAFTALRWQDRSHTREQNKWADERWRLVDTICTLSDRPLPERGWDRGGIEQAEPIPRPRLLDDASQLPKF